MNDLPRGALDGLGLGLVATAVFWWVAPCTLHDETLAVLGRPGAPAAAAGTNLAGALRGFVAAAHAAGIDVHAAGRWFAAIAAGLGVAAVHAAARQLAETRSQALGSAVLVACCPAVAMAATTIHVHAGNLLLASLALWLAALTARRAAWWFALAAGLLAGVAHVMSPIGALLLTAVLPVLWSAAPGRTGDTLRLGLQSLLAVATAVGFAWAVLRGELLAGLPSPGEVGAYDLRTLVPLLWRDAVRSCLPLSLVVLWALFHGRGHREALLLTASVGLHVLAGCGLTATLGDDGSFLLATVPPAALLAAKLLAGRAVLLAACVGVVLSAGKLAVRSDWRDCAEFVGGLSDLAGPQPFTLVSGPRRDEAFLLARLPAHEPVRVLVVCGAAAPTDAAALAAELGRRQRAGQRLFLTAEAEAALRDPVFCARYPAAAPVHRALEATFQWQVVGRRGFVGKELLPR